MNREFIDIVQEVKDRYSLTWYQACDIATKIQFNQMYEKYQKPLQFPSVIDDDIDELF